MKKVDVLIVIEHIARELESACLLKAEFEKRGKNVDIVGVYPNKELLPVKYSADIIILPWAYDDTTMKYINCFFKNSPNAILVNLHHEQYSGQDNYICLPKDSAKDLYHVSWGNRFTKDLLRVGCDKDCVLTVGNIRLDFYKNPLKKLTISKTKLAKEYNLPLNKKWVLFIANGLHLMDDRKIKELNNVNPLYNELRLCGIKTRNDFIEYVDKYLSQNNETVFIYRPHPSYADREYFSKEILDLRKKYPGNFYCISHRSIRDWILNCDLCMSFHSTTIVECCAASVPYYLFRTVTFNTKIDYPFFKEYKYYVDCYEKFINVLKNTEYNNEYVKGTLLEYFLIDSSCSYKEIVNKLMVLEPEKINRYNRLNYIKNYIKYVVKIFLVRSSRVEFIKKTFLNAKDTRFSRVVEMGEDCIRDEQIVDCVDRIKAII